MPAVDLEIPLPHDPGAVFATLTDTARYGEWQPAHDSWPHGDPELVVGRPFVQRTRFMGRSNDVTWCITRLEAPHAIALSGEAGLGMTMASDYRISPAPGGSVLRISARVDGAPRAMQALLRRRARASAEDAAARFAAMLDGDAGATPVRVPPAGDQTPLVLRPLGSAFRIAGRVAAPVFGVARVAAPAGDQMPPVLRPAFRIAGRVAAPVLGVARIAAAAARSVTR